MFRFTRTFRIFVSSTFDDLKVERNALQEKVFPELQKLCEENGCRFQAVDLRWGVSEEAALDQQTMNICLTELKRCQVVSPRPNFIILLGDRYGWIPLPPQVEALEFEEILSQVADDDKRHLADWYRLDTNAVPPEYMLRPRREEVFTETDYVSWSMTEERLRAILLSAVNKLEWTVDDKRRIKYECSATHQEIIEGALNLPDEREHVFAFLRNIQNIEDLPPGSAYTDTDREKAQALKETIKHTTGVTSYSYNVTWNGQELEAHLEQFTADALASLRWIIEEEIGQLKQIDELTRENEAHEEFGAERCQHFVGRQAILDDIAAYIRGDQQSPLVVYGPSGSGKSALMAKVLRDAAIKHKKSHIIKRFIGATPGSTDIRTLLRNLCLQIYLNFGFDRLKEQELANVTDLDAREAVMRKYEIPEEFWYLSERFRDFLDMIPKNHRLILFLDALDQLSLSDNAHSLNWLPSALPANVKVVVSVLEREDDAGECLMSAKSKVPQSALLRLEDMTQEEGKEALGKWLLEAYPEQKRTLTDEQMKSVLDRFRGCPKPLYLKLAFEEARRWKSYDGLPCGAHNVPGLAGDVPGVVSDILARLRDKKQHGEVLVKTFLGLLSAARHGLSETEILELLSADEAVMADLNARSARSPEAKGIPAVVWLRLYHDLEPYLIERSADNTVLLTFYHRQMGETVKRDYIHPEWHTRLARYFRKKADPDGDFTWSGNYVHGLSELPFQLTESGSMWEEVEKTLCDLPFIEAKCTMGKTFDLINDFRRALDAAPGDIEWQGRKIVSEFKGFVLGQAHILDARPLMTMQQAANMPDDSGPARAAMTLFAQQRKGRPWIHWINKPQQEAACIMVLSGHTSSVYACAFSPDGKWIASGGWDGLRIWEVSTGRPWSEQPVIQKPTSLVSWTTRGIWIGTPQELVRYSNFIRIEDSSWRILESHDLSVEEASTAAVSPDGRILALSLLNKKVKIHDFEKDEDIVTLEVGSADSVAISACSFSFDGNSLIMANVFSVCSWDTKSWRKSWNLDVTMNLQMGTRDIQSCVVSPDKSIMALVHPDMISLYDTSSGVVRSEIIGHSDILEGCSFSPDGSILASCSRDGTVRLWSTKAVLSLGTALQRGTHLFKRKRSPMFGVAESSWSDVPASITACAFKQDGTMVTIGHLDGCVEFLDSYSLEEVHPSYSSHLVRACDLSPDGEMLALGRDDGSLEIFNVGDPRGPDSCRGMSHVYAVTSCRFSPDGRLLLSASEDRLLKVWDISTGALLSVMRGHFGIVSDCAWSPVGRTAISSSFDGTLRIWDAVNGCEVAVLKGHECPVHACTFSPNGARVLSGDAYGMLCLWDTRSQKLIRRLTGHCGFIVKCHWSQDGQLLFSASADGECRVWRARDRKCIAVFVAGGPITTSAVTGDGKLFVIADDEIGISVLRVKNV